MNSDVEKPGCDLTGNRCRNKQKTSNQDCTNCWRKRYNDGGMRVFSPSVSKKQLVAKPNHFKGRGYHKKPSSNRHLQL